MHSRWPVFLRTPVAYYMLYVIAFGALLALGMFVATGGISLQELPVRAYNTYQCEVGATLSDPPAMSLEETEKGKTFRIMDVFHLSATELADAMCQHPEIRQQFERVEVAWVHRDRIDMRRLFEKHYDLLIAKPETMEKKDLLSISGYVPIAHYANYSGQLISFSSQPEMSNDYFRGKKLGLLEDTNSVSGYQIPKSALKQNNIDTSQFEILYFKSHLQLYEALHKGKVDVIASFRWSDFDPSAEPAQEKVLRLQSQLRGPRWYLHPDRLDSRSHCTVLDALVEIGQQNKGTYLEDITIMRPCSNG